MNITDFNYDLEYGFVWIEIEHDMTVQCCLDNDDNGKFTKKITKRDCGHNWGCSGENNEKAFNYWGESRCMKTLFNYANSEDFILIN